mmetsp:Transcript_76456/g.216153  ORF Transcript_76456/g.216153 Transcript_76456/m.216153 type:complete len:132 (-) Transcript_76456:139-534(-)
MPKKEACEKISAGLTKAADAPHDIFNGLRLFGTTCAKAVEAEDGAKITKALGFKKRLIQAVSKLVSKIQAHQQQKKQQMAAMEAMQKKAAEAAAAKAAEPGTPGEDADIGDLEDDDDFDSDDDTPAGDDEF